MAEYDSSRTGISHDNDETRLTSLELWRATFLEAVYPVGSIYMSTSSTSPEILFGGHWTPIEGKFLIGANSSYTVRSTGGEATHTLSIAEMPSHNHNSKSLSGLFLTHSVFNPSLIHNASGICRGAQGNSSLYKTLDSLATNSGAPSVGLVYIDATHTHDTLGSSAAHNNMPPYFSVYIWERAS